MKWINIMKKIIVFVVLLVHSWKVPEMIGISVLSMFWGPFQRTVFELIIEILWKPITGF